MKKLFIASLIFLCGTALADEERNRVQNTRQAEHQTEHQNEHQNESRPAPPKIQVMSHPSQIEEKINRQQSIPHQNAAPVGQLNSDRQFSSPPNRPSAEHERSGFSNQPNRTFQSRSPLFNREADNRRFDNREDFRRYHQQEFNRWQSGRWIEGRVHGVFGWYWFIPGLGYYYYTQPVFPYPDAYAAYQNPDDVNFYPENDDNASENVQPQNQPVASWYFCRSANAYYPYVNQCPEEWEVIPAK